MTAEPTPPDQGNMEHEADSPQAPKQAPPPVPTPTPSTAGRSAAAGPAALAAPSSVVRELSADYADEAVLPLSLPQPPGMTLSPHRAATVSPEVPRPPLGSPAARPSAPAPVSRAVPQPQPVAVPRAQTPTGQRRAKAQQQQFAHLSAGLSADGLSRPKERERERAQQGGVRGPGKKAAVGTAVGSAAKASLHQHMQSQDAIIHELGTELSAANERYIETRRTLEASLEASQQNNINLVERLKESNTRIDTLEALREEDRVKWLSTVESWKTHLEETDAKAKRDRETLELRLQAYEQSLQFSDDLGSLLQTAEQRATTLQRQLDEAKAELRTELEQTQRLAEDVEGAKKDLLAALAEQTHSAEQAALLQTMVTSLRTELTKSSVEKDSLQLRIEDLHDQIAKLSTQIAVTESDFSQHKENHILILDKAQADARVDLQNLCSAHEVEMCKLRRDLQVRSEQYEDELGGVRHDILTQSHAHEDEVAALQREFDATLLRLRAQQQQEKKLDHDAAEALKAEIADLEGRSREALSTADGLQAQHDERLFEKTKEIHELSIHLEAAKKTAKTLEAENQVFVRNTAFLETQLEDLQGKQRDDHAKILLGERHLVAAQEREALLRAQVAEAEAKHGVLSERLAHVAAESESASSQLLQERRKIEAAKNNASIEERNARRLEAEGCRLREELRLRDANLEEMRAKSVQQQVDMQQMRLKLVEANITRRGPSVSVVGGAHSACSLPPAHPAGSVRSPSVASTLFDLVSPAPVSGAAAPPAYAAPPAPAVLRTEAVLTSPCRVPAPAPTREEAPVTEQEELNSNNAAPVAQLTAETATAAPAPVPVPVSSTAEADLEVLPESSE